MSVAVLLACLRIYIKASKFHRLFADDILLILATVLLVAGTTVTCLVLPYNQIEVDIGAKVIAPPADLTHILDYDVKLQDAGGVLLNASIFSVKFSFLFFFRLLLHGTGKLRIWWWTVFVFTIPCAIICMCTEFMACPAFGDRIFCMSKSIRSFLRRSIDVSHQRSAFPNPPSVARKQHCIPLWFWTLSRIFRVSLSTSWARDILQLSTLIVSPVISIPVLLLWNVKINLRRKLGLGSLLCLSIFQIITNIIRVVGHNLSNGQNDLVWILFWGEMEACVAVMANSGTVFPSLFAKGHSVLRASPQQENNSPSPRPRLRTPWSRHPQIDLQTLPTAALSGLRSFMFKDPFEDEEPTNDKEMLSPSVIKETRTLEIDSRDNTQFTHRVSIPCQHQSHRNKLTSDPGYV